MNTDLRHHFLKSPEVRKALRTELVRLISFVFVYIVSIGLFRHFTERPIMEGLYSAAIGALFVMLYWIVSAVYTLRSVLREDSTN